MVCAVARAPEIGAAGWSRRGELACVASEEYCLLASLSCALWPTVRDIHGVLCLMLRFSYAVADFIFLPQQLEKSEQEKYDLQRRLKVAESGGAYAAQKVCPAYLNLCFVPSLYSACAMMCEAEGHKRTYERRLYCIIPRLSS